MEAYREVLQDKLRQLHQNYGTAGCHFALEQQKRSCVTLGPLKKEQRSLVTSFFEVLPTEDELGKSFRSDGHRDRSNTYKESVDAEPSITDTLAVTSVQGTTSENEISSDGDVFITPIGTLSNLDDEPSGRRPEVFSRSRQLLRMSVMSSTWRSGRDIC